MNKYVYYSECTMFVLLVLSLLGMVGLAAIQEAGFWTWIFAAAIMIHCVVILAVGIAIMREFRRLTASLTG